MGAKILQNETALYQERYTVGVFESVMNSDFYQTQIKRDQFKKIVEAFNVESQSFTDIDFGDDIAVRPNFTVSSVDFEKGRHCTVSSLSFTGIAVETKRPPNVSTGDIITFVIPEVMGLTTEPTEITYELDAIKYNKHLGKYESFFTVSSETDLSLLNNCLLYTSPSPRD